MTYTRTALLLTLALTTATLTTAISAQTSTAPKKPATTARPAARTGAVASTVAPTAVACAKIPELSPKIPALPVGTPCAKPLYTITTVPTVKLEYVSPLEGPELRETLGLAASSFSLSYIDTKIGTGELAAPHKWYTIHYSGYLLDGTKFDSSLDRGEPISIPYGQHKVIPGWDTGFDGMHVGGKRRLFIPYQLAYGANGQGPIPAKSELIFDVELVAQSDTQPVPKPAPAAAKPADSTKPSEPASTPSDAAPATSPTTTPTTTPKSTPNPQGK